MNRQTIYAALAAAALLAVYAGWLASNWEQKLGDELSGPIAVESSRGAGDRQSHYEEFPLALPEELTSEGLGAFQPQGRFEGASVLDKKGKFLSPASSNRVLVYYLIENLDSGSRYTLLEEEYALESDTDRLVRQIASRGDEIMFDADPLKVDLASLDARLELLDGFVSWRSKLSEFVQVKLRNPSIERYLDAIATLRSQFPDTIVSRDDLYFTSVEPSEYSSALHWHLATIQAPDAWEFHTGEDSVVVAVLDTGCLTSHPDLINNIYVNPGEIADNGIDDDNNGFVDDVSGWDFLDGDAVPQDVSGHGTHVSGIVGSEGNNGIGSSGPSWNVKVMPLKVGDSSGLSSSAIAEALRYVSMMKEAGVNLVATNNSYGSNSPNNVARTEIQNHESLDILFVAAAGNNGEDIDAQGNSQFPAGFPEINVISVANSNQGDALSFGSNYGAESVDIAAPGQDVYSTYSDGGYRFLTGTSMSSPLVAGAVALLASRDPTLSASEIKQRLLDTAEPNESLAGKMVSGGRLDLLAALEPELKGHSIDVVSYEAQIISLPDDRFSVEFEVEALEEASVTVVETSGNPGMTLSPEGDRTYTAQFDQDGIFRFRFEAILNEVARSIDKVVVVGESGDLTSGLMHSWEMEGSGEALDDSIGSGDANLVGSTRVDAPLGGGVDFDGTSSYAQFNASVSPSVTLSAFVKSDDLLSSPHPRIINMPDYYLYFSTRGVADIPDGNANTLKFYSNRSVSFGVWNSLPDTIFQDEWLHVVASYDSSDITNTPSLYINGVKQDVRLQQEPLGAQTQLGGESFLGDRADRTRAWDGQMDEVRVYDRVISDEEVSLLTARYAGGFWDDFSIGIVEGTDQEGSVSIELADVNGAFPDGTFEWSLVTGSETISLGENGNAQIELTAPGAINATVALKVGNALGTRYYRYDLVTDPPSVEAGVYAGTTSNGGVVWIEVLESLRNGYITILVTSTNFTRKREPIEIDAFGAFRTSSELAQMIEGQIDSGFTGQVDSVGIQFSGDQIDPQVGISGFAGEYTGGILGEGSKSLELLVLGNGKIFAWIQGVELDLASGILDVNGGFDLSTQRGSTINGTIEESLRSAEGTLATDSEVSSLYFRNDDIIAENRYVNLSTRGFSDSGEKVLIGGFAISGTSPRTLLLRGVGPDLGNRNVPDFIENPIIKLLKGSDVIQENELWGDVSNLGELISFSERSGAAALPDNSSDAAMLVSLDPGLYTMFLESNGDPGEGLFEIFDLSDQPDRALVNVSTRGYVDGNTTPLIAGLVITGTEPKRVLIRAAGPSLGAQGVQQPLEDPIVNVYSGQDQIATNDNWSEGSGLDVENASVQGPARTLMEAFNQSGAFGFELGSNDSALLIWLEPGLYSAVVNGVDGGNGIALVEVYQVD